jgi:hypothetical protein
MYRHRPVLIGLAVAFAVLVPSGAALAQAVPPAQANGRAPCTAQLASSFGPATGGISDEVAQVQAIAARRGVPLGHLVQVAAQTEGTVQECVDFLLSL